MAQKTILSVGQCGPDQTALSEFLNHDFDVRILTADLPEETLQILRREPVDLVLINRKLDADYSDGINIVRTIKADPELSAVTVMLVSNFDDAQRAAVDAGAAYGFGKQELASQTARDRVAAALTKSD